MDSNYNHFQCLKLILNSKFGPFRKEILTSSSLTSDLEMSEHDITILMRKLEHEFKVDTANFKDSFTMRKKNKKGIAAKFFYWLFIKRKQKREILIKDLMILMNGNRLF